MTKILQLLKNLIKSTFFFKELLRNLDNQFERTDFVIAALRDIAHNSSILDAGCGSQLYRDNCSHLNYKAQDFGQYSVDNKKMIGTEGLGGTHGFSYGHLDYIGDI